MPNKQFHLKGTILVFVILSLSACKTSSKEIIPDNSLIKKPNII